jgi:hypothetical protein
VGGRAPDDLPTCNTTKESKMTNYDVERYVTEELHWDPKIDDRPIAV